MTVFQLLAIFADLLAVKSEYKNWITDISLIEIYMRLIKQRIMDEAKRLNSDVSFDVQAFTQGLSGQGIDLEQCPIAPDELTSTIGSKVEALLLDNRILDGLELDGELRRAIVRDVHVAYSEEVFKLLPLKGIKLELSQIKTVLTQHPELVSIQTLLLKHMTDWDVTSSYILQNQEIMLKQQAQQGAAFDAYFQRTRDENTLTIAKPLPDSPPLAPSYFASRHRLVQDLSSLFEQTSWLAFVGGTGKGKTHLARMVAEYRSGKKVFWISLRGREGDIARQHLFEQLHVWLTQLLAASGHEDGSAIQEAQLFQLIISNSTIDFSEWLLVIDDLPDWANLQNGQLFSELANLGLLLNGKAGKLITSSQSDLPLNLKANLSNSVTEIVPPSLLDDDIQEMLEQAQPPSTVQLKGIILLIQVHTKGHPSLVSAIVHWLTLNNWGQDSASLAALLQGEALNEAKEDTRRYITRILGENQRELLYRLSILHLEFDQTLALELAQVNPALPHPQECLDELVGTWIDQLHTRKYEINPLLRDSGKQNLQPQTLMLVHKTVADYYLSQSPISASDVSPISSHLWEAGEYERFAVFLIQFGLAVKTPAHAKYLSWVGVLFSRDLHNSLWETEVSLSRKIMFRATQIRICILSGHDYKELDDELNQLILKAHDDEAYAVLFAYANIGEILNNSSEILTPSDEFRLSVKVINGFQEATPSIQEVLKENLPQPLEDFVWSHSLRMKAIPDLRVLLSEIRLMTQLQRERLFQSDFAMTSVSYLLDNLWLTEDREQSGVEEWHRVLEILDEVHEVGVTYHIPMLTVAETRARAIILANKLNEFQEALRVLQEFSYPNTAPFPFYMEYTLGCIMYDQLRFQDAVDPLEAASNAITEETENFRFSTKQFLSVSYGQADDLAKSRSACIEAIKLVCDDPDHVYDYLEMLGELSSILWGLGKKRKACAAVYTLVIRLLAIGDETNPRYRELFNKTRHAIGWYAPSGNGESDLRFPSGETYYPVDAGFFSVRRKTLQDYSNPLFGFSKSSLLMPLGMFANVVDLHPIAWYAYKHAMVEAEDEVASSRTLLQTLSIDIAPLAARFGTPTDAVRLGAQAAKTVTGFSQFFSGNVGIEELLTNPPSADTIWNGLPTEKRMQADTHFIYVVLFPFAAELFGSLRSKTEIDAVTDDLKQALVSSNNQLERQGYLIETVSLLQQLLVISRDTAVQPVMPNRLNDPHFVDLEVFWRLASTSYEKQSLADILLGHAAALDYFVQYNKNFPYKHIMPGLGMFIFRRWIGLARTHRFLLRHPSLFIEQLSQISSHQNTKMGIKTIIYACSAVGVTLPDEVVQRFGKAVVS